VAIFHLNFKILKRSEGKSSLYLSAYNSRTRLKDEKTGLVFNYEKKKEDLMHQEIILPDHAPSRFKDRSVLWNEVELQKRKDSQLSRYFIVALPREQTLEQNHKLLTDYIKKNFIKKGMCADIAIHNDADNNNPHAHVMLTMQDVNETGFLNKNREWNNKNNVEVWRRSWAVLVNKTLRENKKDTYISNLSFIRQKELLIQKAKENIEKNNLDDAEKYLNTYEQIKDKKPKKRKPRNTYLNRKRARTYIEKQEREKEKSEVLEVKENKLKLFFNSIINKLINKKEKEKPKPTNEIKKETMKEIIKEEISEEQELLKNENTTEEEFNYVKKNTFQNKPDRGQTYDIPTQKYKV